MRTLSFVGPSGPYRISMTQNGPGLWFELRLGSAPEVRYWVDQRLVRTDKTV